MPAESPLRHRIGAGLGLIETMRFENGQFVRLDLHLARLQGSARELGFRLDCKEVLAALDPLRNGPSLQRIRLVLSQDGAVNATGAAFAPQPETAVWRVAIADTRLASGDPLLRHKTTQRMAYEAARDEFAPDEADEVLLVNQRGEVCEGTITSLFVDFGDGVLATPPLSCGLLAGVLRAQMLERGAAREAPVTPEGLAAAQRFYVGNSLRGLIQAKLDS